jgi:hypothetical protein
LPLLFLTDGQDWELAALFLKFTRKTIWIQNHALIIKAHFCTDSLFVENCQTWAQGHLSEAARLVQYSAETDTIHFIFIFNIFFARPQQTANPQEIFDGGTQGKRAVFSGANCFGVQ